MATWRCPTCRKQIVGKTKPGRCNRCCENCPEPTFSDPNANPKPKKNRKPKASKKAKAKT